MPCQLPERGNSKIVDVKLWFRVLNETMVIRAHAGTKFTSQLRIFRELFEGCVVPWYCQLWFAGPM
jgi:hypothetical protein